MRFVSGDVIQPISGSRERFWAVGEASSADGSDSAGWAAGDFAPGSSLRRVGRGRFRCPERFSGVDRGRFRCLRRFWGEWPTARSGYAPGPASWAVSEPGVVAGMKGHPGPISGFGAGAGSGILGQVFRSAVRVRPNRWPGPAGIRSGRPAGDIRAAKLSLVTITQLLCDRAGRSRLTRIPFFAYGRLPSGFVAGFGVNISVGHDEGKG